MTAPLPDDEILAQLRDYLSEALEEFAIKKVVAGSTFTAAGDGASATACTLQALLAAFLAKDVRGWTHTTRLREHMTKFNGTAAREELQRLALDRGIEITIERTPA